MDFWSISIIILSGKLKDVSKSGARLGAIPVEREARFR